VGGGSGGIEMRLRLPIGGVLSNSIGSGGIYPTLLVIKMIVIEKNKIAKYAGLLIPALGLALGFARAGVDYASHLDRRLDRLEQSVTELRAEIRTLDRAAGLPPLK
jgi:hypothetical protein